LVSAAEPQRRAPTELWNNNVVVRPDIDVFPSRPFWKKVSSIRAMWHDRGSLAPSLWRTSKKSIMDGIGREKPIQECEMIAKLTQGLWINQSINQSINGSMLGSGFSIRL
jgi:hypothetical protein